VYQQIETASAVTNALSSQRSRKSAPIQHFGLLPSERIYEQDVPKSWDLRRKRLVAEMSTPPDLPEDLQIAKALRLLREEQLGILQLAKTAHDAASLLRCPWDENEKLALHYIRLASLILIVSIDAADAEQASARLRLLTSYHGILPEKYRRSALRRLGRDMRGLVHGDSARLPIPVKTTIKYDKYIPAEAYCVGDRYKAGDHLLYVEEAEPLAGADCVLQVWGSPDEPIAAGYEGKPPHFMVGQLLHSTQRTWIVKTAAPHEYTWRLPKKGWGMLGRIVGYRREGEYFHTHH
jgi:hypothetical protein